MRSTSVAVVTVLAVWRRIIRSLKASIAQKVGKARATELTQRSAQHASLTLPAAARSGSDFLPHREGYRRHIKVTTREKSRSVQMWRLRPNASTAMRRSEGNGVPVDLISRCLGMFVQRRMT